MRNKGVNYIIDGNTIGPNAKVYILSNQEPDFGEVELYQDDFFAIGNEAPRARFNPPNEANYYDLVQSTTLRAKNRYADAYIEPEHDALNAFNSKDVTPVSHMLTIHTYFRGVADEYRGTFPGSKDPRPKDYETSLFWSVYIVAGYEGKNEEDNDPNADQATLGVTDGQEKQISVVFSETCRDVGASGVTGRTEAQVMASTVAHEIGHQFGIAANLPKGDTSEHRDNPPNLMSSSLTIVSDNLFYLHPDDIVALRIRVLSPGVTQGVKP